MPKTSSETATVVVDHGPAEDRTEHFDGYTLNFVTIKQDSDLTPLLKGLPGDSCQCPHWGYAFAGMLTDRTVRRAGRDHRGGRGVLPPTRSRAGRRRRNRVRAVQPG